MRILGVDPGLTRCGLGVIDVEGNRRFGLVDVRVARSSAASAPPARIALIADALDEVIDTFRPDAIALERLFAQQNVQTVMGTAQISGVVMLTAQRRGIPIALYTPTEVKAAVTGSGRASKAQVAAMVAKTLGLDALPSPADAADALAIALTHARRPAATGTSGTRTIAQQRWDAGERAARRGSR